MTITPCTCDGYLHSHSYCENTTVVGPWENVKLCHGEMDRNEPSSEESDTEEVLEAQQAIDDLIETESVVVVLPEEEMYDYYLVKLRSACKK